MESSKLKRNPDKTDLIITVHNLGVVLESDFNFRQHISQECKSYFSVEFGDGEISISTAKATSTALISSRRDYCNSLLNNIIKKTSLNSNE